MQRAESLTSPLLAQAGFSHAFFTRRGGVSGGPFESLSFSTAVGDEQSCVGENLRRAAAELGVSAERLSFAAQVHGTACRYLGPTDRAESVLHVEADALYSNDPRIACAVRTADCVPVLLADRHSGAVAAVHAGWRGTAAGIVKVAATTLRDRFGDVDLIAALGPHITLDAFEVSEEVAAALHASAPGAGAVSRAYGPRPHVSLARLIRYQLGEFGLEESAIDTVPGCTVGDPSLFFSYRRDGKRSGRHLSAIVPSDDSVRG